MSKEVKITLQSKAEAIVDLYGYDFAEALDIAKRDNLQPVYQAEVIAYLLG